MRKYPAQICKWIGIPGTFVLTSFGAIGWLSFGCSTTSQPGEVAGTPAPQKSGAELWAQNCVRCHNIRSPSSYSPAQWEVVMMHMRVRGNLTPEEHKKILEFLKSGS
jgi:mono/diheme cytochrome c family protein